MTPAVKFVSLHQLIEGLPGMQHPPRPYPKPLENCHEPQKSMVFWAVHGAWRGGGFAPTLQSGVNPSKSHAFLRSMAIFQWLGVRAWGVLHARKPFYYIHFKEILSIF